MSDAPPPVTLLVDGYNMIGSWAVLKKAVGRGKHIFSDPAGLATARNQLIHLLTEYTAFQGYRTEIVFDAQHRDSPGAAEQITNHLKVYFTDFGQTADTYIERVCSLAWQNRHVNLERIIVATSDRNHRLTVTGYGAEWMSAQRLSDDVQTVLHLIRQKQKSRHQSPRRGLAHQLDPVAKAKLEQMRFK